MKQFFSPLALVVSLTGSVAEANTIPGSVVTCYKSAVSDLFEQALTEGLVRKYVNPEAVVEYLNIPEDKIDSNIEAKIIRSVIAFAQFVKKEIEKREDTTEESDLIFTFYKVYETKIVIKGTIDDVFFKISLEPNGECKVLDFVLE